MAKRPAVPDVLKLLQEFAEYTAESDRARLVRGNSLALARNALFFEQVKEVAAKSFAGKVVPVGFAKRKSPKKHKRVLNVMLSDLHFGSALDGRENRVKYGALEESRRLAKVVKQVCEYKPEHRQETELVVHLLGDIIENQLHDPRVGEPLAKQTCAAIHLLSQAVGTFARHFPKVRVACAVGNHGRFRQRHPERAVFQKWDAIETVVYYAIKSAVKDLKNVQVIIPEKPYYTIDVLGNGVFATHGDTVLRPGNPGKSIDVGSIENQVHKIKASLDSDGVPLRLFLCGHVHVASMVAVGENETFMTNGALVPSNSYAESIGQLASACSQTMWESTAEHIVGDYRRIKVDKTTDKDDSLDEIITPFTDL